MQEESAAGGVQRNFWWKVDLPGAPGVTAHFSPLFDAMWVASDPQHICKPADVSTDSARAHGKHRLYGAHPDRVRLSLADPCSSAALLVLSRGTRVNPSMQPV